MSFLYYCFLSSTEEEQSQYNTTNRELYLNVGGGAQRVSGGSAVAQIDQAQLDVVSQHSLFFRNEHLIRSMGNTGGFIWLAYACCESRSGKLELDDYSQW